MEGLDAAYKLLEESQKGSHFTFKSTDNELCDWLSIERNTMVLSCSAEQHEKKCLINDKEPSFFPFGSINKSSRFSNRRLQPRTGWTRGHERLQVKFEHFTSSSQFIDHYRKAKELRFETALKKLIERQAKRVSPKEGKSKAETTNTTPSHTSGPELEHQEPPRKELVESVTPSLPQTGYFTGKKWVHPKDIQACDNCSRSKRGSKPQVKKPKMQVFNVRNMFLKGTGKPLNNVCNKTWMVPRQRSVSKSAPISRQESRKEMPLPNCLTEPSSRNTTIRCPFRKETTGYSHFNSLVDELKATKLAQESHQTLESLNKVGTAVDNLDQTTEQKSLQYENMFKSVLDMYGKYTRDTRSHVYVKIGT